MGRLIRAGGTTTLTGGTAPVTPADVTLGTPQLRYTEPDFQGKVFAEITVPVTPPDPIGTFDRLLVQLQAPDDAGNKAQVGAADGADIPATVSFTANFSTDILTAAGHPFANGHVVRVRNEGGALPSPLDASVIYAIVNKTSTTFQLAPVFSGTPVNLTDAGTGTHYIYPESVPTVLPIGEPEVSNIVMWEDAEAVIKVTHFAPQVSQQWRIYAASGSAYVQNPIVKADEASPTPSVALQVGPAPSGVHAEEYADLVENFDVGTQEYGYNGDGQRELRIPITWTKPSDARYGGAVICIVPPDGRHIPATGIEPGTTQTIRLTAFPSTSEHWLFYALSVNKSNQTNSYAAGVTPSEDVVVDPPALGGSGIERAPLATGFQMQAGYPAYSVADGGDQAYRIAFEWDQGDVEASPELGGYDVVIEYADGGRVYPASKSANDEPNWTSDLWTVGAASATFTAWLVSYDVNSRRNSIVDGVTPKVVFSIQREAGIAGSEYCANVTGFDVDLPTFAPNGAGQQTMFMEVDWTNPADPKHGFTLLYAIVPGFAEHVQLNGPNPGEHETISIQAFPQTAQTWTIYALSTDTNGRKNTYIPGTTPSETLSVGPPVIGSTGLEYTSNVTSLSVSIEYRITTDGAEEFRFVASYTAPSDVTFGGALLVVQRTTPSAQQVKHEPPNTPWRAPVSGEVFTVYVVSYDVNTRENSVSPTATPKVTGLTPTLQTAGSMNAGRLNSSTIGAGLTQLSGVLRVPVLGITSALVDDFAVTENKLENAQIIGAARIKNAAIENAKFDRASANKIAIVDADIVSLAVNKLLAGTVTVAVTLTSPTIVITSGTVTVNIDAANKIKVTDTSLTRSTEMTGAHFRVGSTSDSFHFGELALDVITLSGSSGTNRMDLTPTGLNFQSIQVVGTRKTSWSAPTGTATRTSFATGSVTLPNLAERVKALIDDLTSHGLIGN